MVLLSGNSRAVVHRKWSKNVDVFAFLSNDKKIFFFQQQNICGSPYVEYLIGH
jgi:hypothetical protein